MARIEELTATAYNNRCLATNSSYHIMPDLEQYRVVIEENERYLPDPVRGYLFATPVSIEPWTRSTNVEQFMAAYQRIAQSYSRACYNQNIVLIPEDELDRCMEYAAIVGASLVDSADSACITEDRRALVRAERELLPAWRQFAQSIMRIRASRSPVEGIILCVYAPKTSIPAWTALCTKFAAPGFHFFLCPQ